MYHSQFITSLSEISAEAWNKVSGTDYPFIRYEFLQALETSGAVSKAMGWLSKHCLIYKNEQLVAVMPNYIKLNSYGEFVFDFQWAEAYQQHGLNYYPKLITAIPYTPATGPRLCVLQGQDEQAILHYVQKTVVALLKQENLSSWHTLFSQHDFSEKLRQQQLPQRRAVHFQWQNDDFKNFDDFLARFSSRQRKNLRKERKKIQEQNIEFDQFSGEDISEELWQQFYHFYQITYTKYSGHGGYLKKSFFMELSQSMAASIVLVMAKREGVYIAGALNFKSNECLYGRYWGATEEWSGLHFETCYYQGIDYCIKHQLQAFDPGVQGEHKIKRGFLPRYTYSNHYIADKEFAPAIAHFLKQEDDYIQQYKAKMLQQSPFKES